MNIKIKLEFYLKAMLGSPRGNQSAPVTGEPTRRQLRREWTASRLITSGRRTRKTLGMLLFFFLWKRYYDDMTTEKAWGEPRQRCRLWRDRPHRCCPRRPSSSRFECQPLSALSRTTWVDKIGRYEGDMREWYEVVYEVVYRRWYSRWYMMWYKRWYEREQTHSLVSSLSYNLGGKDFFSTGSSSWMIFSVGW